MKQSSPKSELLSLRNVGNAVCEDLNRLGITSISQLKIADPDHLYWQLQQTTGCLPDPCMWDVFAAIIEEAQTGVKQNWWDYSPIRKKRQKMGDFLPKGVNKKDHDRNWEAIV